MTKHLLESLSFDNTYGRLPESFYAKLNPTPFDSPPYLVHANRGGVDRFECGLGLQGDDLGQRRLAGARRAVEDRAGEAIGVEKSAEELAGAEEVLLTDELFESAGSHADGERLDAGEGGLAMGGE
jgi:hypothetical protein